MLIGEGPALRAVQAKIDSLLGRLSASHRAPVVLLQGETGTGKGLVARTLHRAGPRGNRPFVNIDCAAIPEPLLEAELFGYERGAFTDARHAKPGLFEAANEGVIFLDEVGLLPRTLQAKLLKVIDERAVRRLGSTRSLPVGAWIIAATNEDLQLAVKERRFREDLYHRIAGLTIHLPALRERGDDIGRLAAHFLTRACAEHGLPPKFLSADAHAALSGYAWPGNVRELMNIMERVVLMSDEQWVTAPMLELPHALRAVPDTRDAPVGDLTLDGIERARLVEALEATRWNISFAADCLGVPRNTLRYRMAQHSLRAQGSPPRRRRKAQVATTREASGLREDIASQPKASGLREIAVLRAQIIDTAELASSWSGRLVHVLVDNVRRFAGHVEEVTVRGVIGSFRVDPVEAAARRAAYAALAMRKGIDGAQRAGDVRVGVAASLHVVEEAAVEGLKASQVDSESWRFVLEELLVRAEPSSIVVSRTAAPFLERRFALAPLGMQHRGGRNSCQLIGLDPTSLGFA